MKKKEEEKNIKNWKEYKKIKKSVRKRKNGDKFPFYIKKLESFENILSNPKTKNALLLVLPFEEIII